MAIEKVRAYFRPLGLEERIQEFSVSSATVELAAQALGTEPARIAKTLSFAKDDSCILVVMAGDAKVDNKKFKETFGMKAKMLDADAVERLLGHAVGGVCPFGIPTEIEVYTDVSLKRFDMVYPAAGSSNSAIGLTPAELYQYANARQWVDVGKAWQAPGPGINDEGDSER